MKPPKKPLRCMICGTIHPTPCPDACPECRGLGVIRIGRQRGVSFDDLGIKRCPACRGKGRKK